MRSQLLCACLIVLAACNGTRTGNPIGDDNAMQPDGGGMAGSASIDNTGGLTGEFGGPNCKATPSPLDSRDADTALGFSAADILAFAAGVHETKIRWQTAGIGSYAPESGEHGLTLHIEPTSAKPRFVTYEEVKQDAGVEGSGGPLIDIGEVAQASCESFNALEIDVMVEIKSDGGALDEKLEGVLRAQKNSLATLQLPIDAKNLKGSFHLVDAKVGDLMFKLDQIQIGLGLSPFGVRGAVGGTFSSEPDGATTGASIGVSSSAAGAGGIAQIGASEDCDPDGLPIEADQKLEQFDAQDAIDLVNHSSPLTLTWQNGTNTQFSLAFAPDAAAICAVVEPSGLSSPTDLGLLRLRGTLDVRTEDGRIYGHWPVVIEAKPITDGTLGDVSVVFEGPNSSQAPIQDLAGEYGVQGIDASGYDGANVMFKLQFVGGTTHDLAGMLTISGLTQAMCPPPPSDPSMGAPGCGGIDLTTLDSATLSAP